MSALMPSQHRMSERMPSQHGVSAHDAPVAGAGRRMSPTVAGSLLLAAATLPFLVDDYTASLLARALVLGLVAVSVALLTGIAGLPTLGQTAPFAAGAYACAVVNLHATAGSPPIGAESLLIGALAGAALAAATAPLIIHARGVVVLMITLAVGELAATTAGRWKSVTGGTDGLIGLTSVPALWGTPVLDTDKARYWFALATVVVVLGLTGLALRTPAGALLRASRDHEGRMRASGHPVTAYLFAVVVLAGAIAGVAGSLLVTVQQYVSPADFGFDTSALLLLAVVIGGAESLGGAIAGTAVIIAARDWLSGLLPGQAPILLGTLFVLTAYLLPRGLRGLPAARLLPVAGALPRWLRTARRVRSSRRLALASRPALAERETTP
jgi:branched-chain amino acid transport system permease protein